MHVSVVKATFTSLYCHSSLSYLCFFTALAAMRLIILKLNHLRYASLCVSLGFLSDPDDI